MSKAVSAQVFFLKQLALHAAWNAVNSRLFPWQTSRPQLIAESLVNLEYLALEHEDVASRTCCLVLCCSLGGLGSLCQAKAGPRDWHQKRPGLSKQNATAKEKGCLEKGAVTLPQPKPIQDVSCLPHSLPAPPLTGSFVRRATQQLVQMGMSRLWE